MNHFKAVSVFCGSSAGNDERFLEDARSLGSYLAEHRITLIYGGARVGLMGVVADAVLEGGGLVTGVLPDFITNREIAHQELTEMITVSSMHERKSVMHERSDAAIVLPGGYGTMDEMFELLTWGQLGLHAKPVGILNSGGFYDGLISFIDQMVTKSLLRIHHRKMLQVSGDIPELFDLLQSYDAPAKAKWISPDQV